MNADFYKSIVKKSPGKFRNLRETIIYDFFQKSELTQGFPLFFLLFFINLILFLAFTLGCNPGNLGVTHDDWLIRRLPAEPDTLNPLTATDIYESIINNDIYESLLDRDLDTLQLTPELASTWEVSANGLVYTFKLKDGIKFHDGTPVTAWNFKYAYARIMDEKVNAPHLRNYYKDIKSVEVLDDKTIRFTYSEIYFRALEICGGIPALPKHLFEQHENFNKSPLGRAPVGTGPYKFVQWTTGQKIVLERNENYWGEKPHIKKIVYRVITESAPSLIELKKRRLDLMPLTSLQWVRQTESERFHEAFRKEKYYQPNFNYIGWNLRRPYFSDKRVRRALTMMVDRQRILENLLFNLGIIVTGPNYVNSPYYDESIKPIPYDPAEAQKLLNEAGWIDHDGDGVRDKNGVAFKFEFLITGSEFSNQLATLLNEEFHKAGIDMEIRQLEWATFTKMLDERNFDAVTLGWSLGVETDPYQIWHSSQIKDGSNFVGFSNPQADKIIEEVRRTLDVNRRIELLKRFHAILHEEQPYTFLFCSPSLVAISKRFGNVIVHKMGLEPREWTVPAKLTQP